MKQLLTTSALALALGATAFADPAAAVDREPSYCGQSWLQVDTDNDGKVTQSEADAAFAREFSEIDASGDGIISRDEYRECRTSQITSAAEQMRGGGQMQGRADRPLKDRRSAANAASEGKKSPIQAQTLQQVLRAADANDDGILTRREYAMAARKAYDEAQRAKVDDAHREAVTDPSLVAMRRFIVLVPKDGQGEQQADRQLRQMSRDEAAARSAMKFGALDRDDDGRLAESDWTAAAGDMMSGSMAEEHFEAMDEDGDGQVSREEYRKARKADMGEAEEAIQAWDEPQTLSEDAGSGQQARQQSGQQAGGQQQKKSEQQASGRKAGDRQEAAVPVYIFRFHTM